MQPTYLPWIGYFGMMDRVDTFVFLDSVQFAKRSWQQRNRIKTLTGPIWLSVPVLTRGMGRQLIKDVKIDRSRNFAETHMRTIEHNYRRCPYFEDVAPPLYAILQKEHNWLSELTIEIIIWVKEILGIKARLIRSSELTVSGQKAEFLANICQILSAREYLSAPGSQEYIEASDAFEKRCIAVSYHNYEHPEYRQVFGEFISHMAVIDLLFNEGFQSLSIIQKGYNL